MDRWYCDLAFLGQGTKETNVPEHSNGDIPVAALVKERCA